MRLLLLTSLLGTLAYAQSDLRNSVTFGAGYGRDVNAACCQTDTAVSLDVTYGYRIWPFLQVEAGLATALNPVGGFRGANYDVQPDNRFIWVPFGVRGILPLHSDRVELSLVAGGLYEKFTIAPNPPGVMSRGGWGESFGAGAAVALDHGRHFWLGASPRFYLANTGGQNDRWFVITGDFSFRF
jgi:hypothetical protein